MDADNTKTKKKWRRDAMEFKNFRGNKTEGQGFADMRKKKAFYEFKKMKSKEMKKDIKAGKTVPRTAAETRHSKTFRSNPDHKPEVKKSNTYVKPHQIYEKRKVAQQKVDEDNDKKREGMSSALKSYEKKKKSRNELLKTKTRRGQPVMSKHMDLILEKLQNDKT